MAAYYFSAAFLFLWVVYFGLVVALDSLVQLIGSHPMQVFEVAPSYTNAAIRDCALAVILLVIAGTGFVLHLQRGTALADTEEDLTGPTQPGDAQLRGPRVVPLDRRLRAGLRRVGSGRSAIHSPTIFGAGSTDDIARALLELADPGRALGDRFSYHQRFAPPSLRLVGTIGRPHPPAPGASAGAPTPTEVPRHRCRDRRSARRDVSSAAGDPAWRSVGSGLRSGGRDGCTGRPRRDHHGAGRGIGREHALLFAAEGAKVVVNDLGGGLHGESEAASAAEQVVEEITSFGGEAIANHDDVADWAGGQNLVRSAVEHFGDLHVLVNNAGILRDRVLVNLSEEDWDSVIKVHLKGHFVPSRHAATYWRERAKEGHEVKASIINTSSTSGLLGNIGQSNYGAAKAGIAAFTVIIADELGRYGVRANAIAPAARTRMTESTPALADAIAAPEDAAVFDSWDPANVSPLVAWLATEHCPASGRVFFVQGGVIRLFQNWTMTETLEKADRFTIEELEQGLPKLLQ